MNDKNTEQAQIKPTASASLTASNALLSEAGSDNDPFADGSTAVFQPKQPGTPAAGVAAGGASKGDPFADPGKGDPFADPGKGDPFADPNAPASAAADAANVVAMPEQVPVPEEAQGLFGGAFSGLGGFAMDIGSLGTGLATLAVVGGGADRGKTATTSDAETSGGMLDNPNLQSGVSTVAFGLDEGAKGTPIEGPVGVVAQVLLNVVPGGDDSNDVLTGREEYPNIFAVFGPGAEQAEQGFNDTVGQILTTELNDQLTAELLPLAMAIGSIAQEQPIFTSQD